MLSGFFLWREEMFTFRGNIAGKFGINAAVVAEYLYSGADGLEERELAGRTWYRCSSGRITADNPFLTADMVKRAVGILRDEGIVRSKRLSKCGFDHTNWYCFTEYGETLMEGGE